MKLESVFILAVLAIGTSVCAQAPTPQPAPPPASVFPLGGLSMGLSTNESDAERNLRLYGLNMIYNGNVLLPMGQGQGGIVDVGGAAVNGISVDNFFPQSSFNKYYAQTDINLVSNESDDAAWDLNNVWSVPLWKQNVSYQPGQLVISSNAEWVCSLENLNIGPSSGTTDATTGAPYWAEVKMPQDWISGTSYQLGDYVLYLNKLWKCNTNETTPQTPGGSDWTLAVWDPSTTYHPGELVSFFNDPNNPNPSLPFPVTIWVADAPYDVWNKNYAPKNYRYYYPPVNQAPSSGSNNWVQLATKTGQANGQEWKIARSDDNNTELYLDYNFYANGPLTATVNGGDFLGGGSTVYLDFISRLDPGSALNPNYPVYPANSPGYASSSPVYEIVATAQFDDANKTTLQKDLTITYGDYSAYLAGGTYGTTNFGNDVGSENRNILQFPNQPWLTPKPTPQNYSVFRIPFDLRSTSIALSDSANVHISSIHFTLKRVAINNVNGVKSGSNGIFVRGVRLRTFGADCLYRGKMDNGSNCIWGPQSQNPNNYTWPGFGAIFSAMKTAAMGFNNGATGLAGWNNNFIGSQAGLECAWPCLRTYAYINELWRKWTKAQGDQKDIYEFFLVGSDFYRHQYDNTDPPILDPKNPVYSLTTVCQKGRVSNSFSVESNNNCLFSSATFCRFAGLCKI